MAIFGCDSCMRFYEGEPVVINAKQWDKNICEGPFPTQLDDCIKFDCRYNVEGICVEFHFCDRCSTKPKKLNKKFNNFHH